jgi:hypothetical protein
MAKILMSILMSSKILVVILSSYLLSACSVFTDKGNETKSVVLSQVITLQPVPKNLQQRVWLEKFTFAFNNPINGQKQEKQTADKISGYAIQSMLLQTELTEQGINIAAISFEGIPLAQASWQSISQSVKSELTVAKNFDAKQVLHDLQIVNWPIKLIAPALANNFSVDEQIVPDSSTGDKIKTRRFYHQSEVIIIIRYQKQEISFEQLSAGYRLLITRLTDNDLPAVLKP